ncbi:MAG: hypothetical protein DRJ66_06415 [Thermoprotei archaeon]|nr:MAG: hypothetical protein DRJ66_06415 [Thermoprotei archaeon]RLF20609.1 MAG: hypothetical protein DRZ82_01700 [Thermoprotei archaeon]
MAPRIGVTIWSLGTTKSEKELRKQLEIAQEIGVEGVQLWCVDYGPDVPCLLDPDRCGKEERRRIRHLIVDVYGLEITGCCAQLSGTKGIGGLDDPEGLDKRIEKTKKALELAVDIEAPIVTTHPGVIPEDKSDPRYNVIFNSITEIGKYAERLGAYFCIETGLERPIILKEFIEEIGSEGVKVNYDPANLLKYGKEEVVNGVKILGKLIVHTHAKDYNPETKRATVGEGLVPWSDYLKALKEVGYNGWLAIEDETGIDVVNSIKKGKRFLESMISNIWR